MKIRRNLTLVIDARATLATYGPPWIRLHTQNAITSCMHLKVPSATFKRAALVTWLCPTALGCPPPGALFLVLHFWFLISGSVFVGPHF